MVQDFKRVSIFRPGLLDRTEQGALPAKGFGGIVPSIKVSDVALCMRLDAERKASGVQVFGMKQMLAAAKDKCAP